jgi:lipopolysaccharide/colanic/teichoic acid biosynthesis glycosyltransferase
VEKAIGEMDQRPRLRTGPMQLMIINQPRAGITGLAQVRGRSGISFDRIVENDIEYLEKRSLALDLKVLAWTLATVVFGTAAE